MIINKETADKMGNRCTTPNFGNNSRKTDKELYYL